LSIEEIVIYVKLLDEGIDVWRPIRARLVASNIYEILEQTYDHDIETWEFEPGEQVVCIRTSDNRLYATERQRIGVEE
jgi:hypothetical protein